MKRCYRADLLKTLADEDCNIIALWKEMSVGCYIGESWTWSSMNPVMLVPSWKKPVPNLEEDNLQHFPNKEISKSEILDMVCVMRSLKNGDKDNIK
jgi:hypothetical protein